MRAVEKQVFLVFWCWFSRSENNFIFQKIVFSLEFELGVQILSMILSIPLISIHILSHKNVPKGSFKVLKNPLKIFVWIWNHHIEFDLAHYEIPQLSLHCFKSSLLPFDPSPFLPVHLCIRNVYVCNYSISFKLSH